MQHQESQFIAHGNLPLYCQSWKPNIPAIAVLIIVHGLSEHSARYMNLVNKLVLKGVTVHTFDHRGHGRSAKKLVAHVDNWLEYLEDLKAFVNRVAIKEPNTPLFLMGHSMGGLITANYVLHYPLGFAGGDSFRAATRRCWGVTPVAFSGSNDIGN